mgnify:CR=1 FL=1
MGNLQDQLVHACQLTVLTCIDFRLHGAWNLNRCLQELFGSNVSFDLLTMPGACYRLAREGQQMSVPEDSCLCNEGVTEEAALEPEDRCSVVLSDLSLSISLHQPESLLLIQHENCGRYQADHEFASLADERRVLMSDLKLAAGILQERFPRLRILGYVARIDLAMASTIGLDQVFNSTNPTTR